MNEEWCLGYDAGYQDGFDAALADPVKQEPVAWVDAKEEGYEFHGMTCLPTGKHYLYAAPVDAKAIRAEALEEAAKVCESKELRGIIANMCAASIRGLK